MASDKPGTPLVLERRDLEGLFRSLRARGYRIIGPVRRDSAIVYDALGSAADLPVGWSAEHGPGRYRLTQRTDGRVFGDVVGPMPWRRFLHPPAEQTWTATREATGFRLHAAARDETPYAFVGVRPCDLHALAVLDRVLCGGRYVDCNYLARRTLAFVVAVNCTQSAATCFCTSMKTGPAVDADVACDLVLTELVDAGRHEFVVDVRSDRGLSVIADVPHSIAHEDRRGEAERLVARTAVGMVRSIDPDGLKERLYDSYQHPRWDEVAARCLACGNCTAVCPTCFCTTVADTTDLHGSSAHREHRSDSCFGLSFSHLHGGDVRTSIKSRYRHWVMHKLATWVDQFGTSGCVGCGRCITWCPAGIDITEVVGAIRAGLVATPAAGKDKTSGNARTDFA